MSSHPSVNAILTFLSQAEAGRRRPPLNSPAYRPHLVVEDPGQAAVATNRLDREQYLGISFTGRGGELSAGLPHEVTLTLIYHPRVNYDALKPGARFTIREGWKIVGSGTITDLQVRTSEGEE